MLPTIHQAAFTFSRAAVVECRVRPWRTRGRPAVRSQPAGWRSSTSGAATGRVRERSFLQCRISVRYFWKYLSTPTYTFKQASATAAQNNYT